MKLIIDIPDEIYDDIKHGYICSEYADTLIQLIPSSKPYDTSGGLISREDLKKHIAEIVETEEKIDKKWAMGLKYSLKLIDNAPIVEQRSYGQGFRDGYAQCITDNEERKESNRLFQGRGKEE